MDKKTINVLLTGGAGYIGSHTYISLINAGFSPVILDNFANSNKEVLDRLKFITNRPVLCEFGDVCNRDFVEKVILKHKIVSVIHFAAFKSISESVSNPLKYYNNNLVGLVSLLDAMSSAGCRTIVYSSSATVYGQSDHVPIEENSPRTHTNPYGHTKLIGEDMLDAMKSSNPDWKIGVLRYFNPAGAHSSGLIGEDPNGIPSNLMPFVSQVAIGKLACIYVYGTDYETPDGTGVRDYIHVMDLADAHVAALKTLQCNKDSFVVNIGTGRGYSVYEVIKVFEQISGRTLPFINLPRRPGDVARCWADINAAKRIIGWSSKRSLVDMCSDSWKWQQLCPEGYTSKISL